MTPLPALLSLCLAAAGQDVPADPPVEAPAEAPGDARSVVHADLAAFLRDLNAALDEGRDPPEGASERIRARLESPELEEAERAALTRADRRLFRRRVEAFLAYGEALESAGGKLSDGRMKERSDLLGDLRLGPPERKRLESIGREGLKPAAPTQKVAALQGVAGSAEKAAAHLDSSREKAPDAEDAAEGLPPDGGAAPADAKEAPRVGADVPELGASGTAGSAGDEAGFDALADKGKAFIRRHVALAMYPGLAPGYGGLLDAAHAAAWEPAANALDDKGLEEVRRRARITAVEDALAQQKAIVAKYEKEEKDGWSLDVKSKDKLQELRLHTPSGVSVRGGAFGLGDQGPWGVLDPSPYAAVDYALRGTGSTDRLLKVGAGYARVESHRAFEGAGDLQSPASGADPKQDEFGQNVFALSAYYDTIKPVRLGENVGAAFGLAIDGWALQSGSEAGMGTRGLVEGNLGGGIVYRPTEKDRLSLDANLQLEAGQKSLYRNFYDPKELTVVAEGVYVRADYERHLSADSTLTTGAEVAVKPWAVQLRPEIEYASGAAALGLQGHLQKSRNDFFADEVGAAATARYRLTDRATLGLEAGVNFQQDKFTKDTEAQFRTMGMLEIELDKPKSSVRVSRTLASADTTPGFDAADSRARKPDMSLGGAQAEVRADVGAAMKSSKDFKGFAASVAGSVDDYQDLLAAASVVGGHFNDNNYNSGESADHPNVNTLDGVFADLQSTWNGGDHRDTGVCITQSQFVASMINEVAEQKGWKVRAMGTTFMVPDEKGGGSGHSAVVVKGPDGRITFQDWNGIVPTNARNADDAYEVYQGLQGIVTPYWTATDPDKGGRHLAFRFTDEGRQQVEALTVLDEASSDGLWDNDPRGNKLTRRRITQAAARAALGVEPGKIVQEEPLGEDLPLEYLVAKMKARNLEDELKRLKAAPVRRK